MHADLAPKQMQFLHTAIANGKYRDEAEALNEAVWLLQRRDELEQSLLEASLELDAGLGIPAEDVFRHLEEKVAEIERQSKSNGRSCESYARSARLGQAL